MEAIPGKLNLGAFVSEGMTEVVNVGRRRLKFAIGVPGGGQRNYNLKPGDRTLVESGYLKRRLNGGGDAIPSVIDLKTGVNVGAPSYKFSLECAQVLVPVDSDQARKFFGMKPKEPESKPEAKVTPAKDPFDFTDAATAPVADKPAVKKTSKKSSKNQPKGAKG